MLLKLRNIIGGDQAYSSTEKCFYRTRLDEEKFCIQGAAGKEKRRNATERVLTWATSSERGLSGIFYGYVRTTSEVLKRLTLVIIRRENMK